MILCFYDYELKNKPDQSPPLTPIPLIKGTSKMFSYDLLKFILTISSMYDSHYFFSVL